jgi:hypothetical protein
MSSGLRFERYLGWIRLRRETVSLGLRFAYLMHGRKGIVRVDVDLDTIGSCSLW